MKCRLVWDMAKMNFREYVFRMRICVPSPKILKKS